MEHHEGYRTAYYSVVLGITVYTYFPGYDDEARAIRSAKRDAEDGYEGSAPVRVEWSADGRTWREHGRYEAAATVADALDSEGS